MTTSRISRATLGCLFAWAAIGGGVAAVVGDHGDTPSLSKLGRHDARIGDFYAFTRGDQLVFAMTVDPTIPVTARSYKFPSDVEYRFLIDRDSPVHFDAPDDMKQFGGTVVRPDGIAEDAFIEITFDSAQIPSVVAHGLADGAGDRIKLFVGLRDDPFIRGTLIGKNIAAIVVDLPLRDVVGDERPTLLVWSTTDVRKIPGSPDDLGGRVLRSQYPDLNDLNTHHPSKHLKELKLDPDVVIFRTALPAVFPNGRDLVDDVVDLVGRQGTLDSDAPFPTQNDVPFLPEFPYLAPPHGAPAPPPQGEAVRWFSRMGPLVGAAILGAPVLLGLLLVGRELQAARWQRNG